MIPKGDYQKSNSDDWATPNKLYKLLMKHNYYDPCPLHSKVNNLNIEFEKDKQPKKMYINPPFSQMDKWVKFAIKHFKKGSEILFLMPARTDTRYFHDLLDTYPTIIFIKGRLEFNDCGIKAPFPTILVRMTHDRFKYKVYYNCDYETLLNIL